MAFGLMELSAGCRYTTGLGTSSLSQSPASSINVGAWYVENDSVGY
jgi:hypothetical protein